MAIVFQLNLSKIWQMVSRVCVLLLQYHSLNTFFFEHFFENQDALYLSCTYTTPTLKSGIFPGSRGLFTEKCYIETKSYVLAVLVCSLLLGVLQLLDRRPGTLEKYLIWGLGHWKYKVSLENLILSKSKKVLRKTRHKT